jgi:hypothetical protein
MVESAKTMNISPIDRVKERVTILEGQVELLLMLLKQGTPTPEAEVRQETKKLVQINARGKKYFCTTAQEQEMFTANNPDVPVEIFNIELPVPTADKYLNDAENKKQFAVKAVRN